MRSINRTMNSQLPDKPSSLILVALADLAKVEKSRKYQVDMGIWHEPGSIARGNRCQVCLAGAVMARSLGADPKASFDPSSFPLESDKLSALDCFRTGAIRAGLACFGLRHDRAQMLKDEFEDSEGWAPSYEERSAFKRYMRRLAKFFASKGL